jgi:hypothetical protein
MAGRHTGDSVEASSGLHLRKRRAKGHGGNGDAFSGGTRSGGDTSVRWGRTHGFHGSQDARNRARLELAQ